MAKQKGKIKPLYPQMNMSDISLNDLLSMSGTVHKNDLIAYDAYR